MVVVHLPIALYPLVLNKTDYNLVALLVAFLTGYAYVIRMLDSRYE